MKKIITFLTVVALTASLAIGVTTAYLTDEDEDVNVMTLGNVYIDQIEQERDDSNQLVDFEDNQPLYPAVYPDGYDFENPTVDTEWENAKLWDETIKNAHDKIVTVENTGKSDSYVRTWFAFENGTAPVHINLNDTDWTWSEVIEDVTIAGTVYDLYVATYNGVLKPGETTPPSLLQVALDKSATNEDVAAYGDTYEILVYSQAVQVEGFKDDDHALDTAFGTKDAEHNPWTGVTGVAGSTGTLKNTLGAGGNITVGSDINITSADEAAKNAITTDTVVNFGDSVVTLDIPDADSSTSNWVGINVNGGEVVFNGTTGGIKTADNAELYAVVVRDGADLTINGGEYIGGTSAVSVTEGTVTINGGYFASQAATANYLINCIDAAYRDGTAKVIIKGGSFLNWNPADNASEGADTNFVADGYKVVVSTVEGGTLYTVVAE